MADRDQDRATTIATLLIALGLVYVWFRFAGKVAEKAIPPVVRITSRTIGEVIERAEQITKQAVESAGKEGNGAS